MTWEEFNEKLFKKSWMTRADFEVAIGFIDMDLTNKLPFFSKLPIEQQQAIIEYIFRRDIGQ